MLSSDHNTLLAILFCPFYYLKLSSEVYFRLHDYYQFNVSRFVNEGVFATEDYQVGGLKP